MIELVDNPDRLKDQIKYMVKMIRCVIDNKANKFEKA